MSGSSPQIQNKTHARLRSPEVKRQFKAYTDSVRAVRAANGGVIKATHPEAVSYTHLRAKEKGNVDLYNRLMEEALWGMDYVMKTRLGDGYRARCV